MVNGLADLETPSPIHSYPASFSSVASLRMSASVSTSASSSSFGSSIAPEMCRWQSASLPPWRQVVVASWRGSVTPLLGFLVVVGRRAARGTTAAALERIDFAIDLSDRIPAIDALNRRFKPAVLEPSADHVGRCRSVVIAGLPIDALAFIAAVVAAFPASAGLEHCVRQCSPPFACALHPFAAVKCAALRSTASFGMRGICSAKPLGAFAVDAVVLTLGHHQVRVWIVFGTVRITALMDGQGIR